MLRALLQQTGNKLALLFDNLETVQDPASGRLKDETIAAWLEACQPGAGPAPLVLATSRWVIPEWESSGRAHHFLRPPSYGDFLRFQQQLGGRERSLERLRRLYRALGGNFKGLELFHAVQQAGGDEEAFLQRLEQSRAVIAALYGGRDGGGVARVGGADAAGAAAGLSGAGDRGWGADGGAGTGRAGALAAAAGRPVAGGGGNR